MKIPAAMPRGFIFVSRKVFAAANLVNAAFAH
jgi:hypothetical protein